MHISFEVDYYLHLDWKYWQCKRAVARRRSICEPSQRSHTLGCAHQRHTGTRISSLHFIVLCFWWCYFWQARSLLDWHTKCIILIMCVCVWHLCNAIKSLALFFGWLSSSACFCGKCGSKTEMTVCVRMLPFVSPHVLIKYAHKTNHWKGERSKSE